MNFLRKLLVHSPAHYVAAVVLAVVVAVLRFLALPEGTGVQFAWYESLSVAGYVTFLIGALLAVAYFGAFDLFTFAFSPGRFAKNRKYENYTQYSQRQEEKRAGEPYYFVPYFVVGLAVFLISFLLA